VGGGCVERAAAPLKACSMCAAGTRRSDSSTTALNGQCMRFTSIQHIFFFKGARHEPLQIVAMETRPLGRRRLCDLDRLDDALLCKVRDASRPAAALAGAALAPAAAPDTPRAAPRAPGASYGSRP
jgi:hypothetical protein